MKKTLPIFGSLCPRTKDLIAIWSAILTSGRLDFGMAAENSMLHCINVVGPLFVDQLSICTKSSTLEIKMASNNLTLGCWCLDNSFGCG